MSGNRQLSVSALFEEDQPRLAGYVAQLAAGSTRNNIEFNVVHRNSSRRWFAISWQPMIELLEIVDRLAASAATS